MLDSKKKKSLKIVLGFIGGIIIIALVVAFIVFALRFVKQKELEYSVRVADHIFYLRDTGECDRWHFSDEEDFLNYCTDEEVANIVSKYFHFDHILHVGDEVVIIILQEPVVNHCGYAIVRNDVELPNEETEDDYLTARFEKINERVYSFTWMSMAE